MTLFLRVAKGETKISREALAMIALHFLDEVAASLEASVDVQKVDSCF